MLRATSILQKSSVQAIDGKIGSVSDILFDAASWKVRWLVVDTGGWLTGRRVLIHPAALGEPDGSRDRLYVEMTKEQISNSPTTGFDPPVSQQMEEQFRRYDGLDALGDYQAYGSGAIDYPIMLPSLFGGTGSSTASGAYSPSDHRDPNLHSASELVGYHIRAVDGGVGHLEEFLLDDDCWSVSYLVIETKNWLAGSHIMLAPHAVVEFDWSHREIWLNVTSDQVRTSPPAWPAGAKTPTEPKRT